MNQDEWLGTLKYASSKAQDKASVDSLMLRYRPIAPKPTSGPPCAAGDNSSSNGMNKRIKRKYVRVSKNNKSNTCRGKSRSTVSDDAEQSTEVVTLQLMPEKSDLSGEYTDSLDPTVETIIGKEMNETDTCMMFNGDLTADKRGRRLTSSEVVESWVTVESVTDGGILGSRAVEFTDIEVMDNLGKDTCPTFVSDRLNRVVWVNEAYRRSVLGEGMVDSAEVVVWLVIDESLTAIFCEYGALTCRVRMQYTWQEMKYTKTVPCDVWRMEFGGFAWRLDTTAALTLWL